MKTNIYQYSILHNMVDAMRECCRLMTIPNQIRSYPVIPRFIVILSVAKDLCLETEARRAIWLSRPQGKHGAGYDLVDHVWWRSGTWRTVFGGK